MSEQTYLSEAEGEAVQRLHQRTPYVIQGVTRGYFSIARHYGGATVNGSSYTYMPATDELVRDDVLKLVTRLRMAAAKIYARDDCVQSVMDALYDIDGGAVIQQDGEPR